MVARRGFAVKLARSRTSVDPCSRVRACAADRASLPAGRRGGGRRARARQRSQRRLRMRWRVPEGPCVAEPGCQRAPVTPGPRSGGSVGYGRDEVTAQAGRLGGGGGDEAAATALATGDRRASSPGRLCSNRTRADAPTERQPLWLTPGARSALSGSCGRASPRAGPRTEVRYLEPRGRGRLSRVEVVPRGRGRPRASKTTSKRELVPTPRRALSRSSPPRLHQKDTAHRVSPSAQTSINGGSRTGLSRWSRRNAGPGACRRRRGARRRPSSGG